VRETGNRESYEKMVTEHAAVLQYASSMAISALFLGPSFTMDFTNPSGVMFSWINEMFQRKREKVC
jgi:hypothetical protein